ncbi:MAG: UDP-glucose 4-epimerase GalE [Chitinophagaceae bacterium]|nr:UDP-glucose 4-epimerase GalE [Chitinophagaceae bacterium]
MNKKVIITGGAGYIGSHTAIELHNNGFTPIIVDNFYNADSTIIPRIEKIIETKVKCYTGDCTDNSFIENILRIEKQVFGVIHFAAYKAVGESVHNPLKYYKNNIISMIVFLELLKKYDIQNFIYSSSCTVYGIPDNVPVLEDSPIKPPTSPYGNTKKICEDILQDTVKAENTIKGVILRYFNPIGAHPTAIIGEFPKGTPNNLLPYITQTAAGLREKVTIFGNDYPTPDGTCMRDYIHVVDLAKAHIAALNWIENQPIHTCEVFNLGTGKSNSVLEIIQLFQKLNAVKVNYEIGKRRSGDVPTIYADVIKSKKILNWETKLSLEDALVHAWNWEKSLRNN